MFKIFAFLKRNAALTRDEFRAGLIGYHAGHSRRMRGVRGYMVNIQSDRRTADTLRALHRELVWEEPAGFADEWDGFPAMWFDGPDGWRNSREPEKTRAMENGLAVDPDRSPTDGPFLFDPSPDGAGYRSRPVRVEEIPVLPVERPERKLTKLVQFFRRNPAVDERAFRAGVIRHAALAAGMAGLWGYTLNLRDPDEDAALRGVYPDGDWRLTGEGRDWRRAFTRQWDGAAELWFDDLAAFVAARTAADIHPALWTLERELFEAVWWAEVDESVVVMPNRDPAPAFYYR
jgi:hypothetical protein